MHTGKTRSGLVRRAGDRRRHSRGQGCFRRGAGRSSGGAYGGRGLWWGDIRGLRAPGPRWASLPWNRRFQARACGFKGAPRPRLPRRAAPCQAAAFRVVCGLRAPALEMRGRTARLRRARRVQEAASRFLTPEEAAHLVPPLCVGDAATHAVYYEARTNDNRLALATAPPLAGRGGSKLSKGCGPGSGAGQDLTRVATG